MSTATTSRTEFKSSELNRNSGEVFAAADNGPVRVTRRDGGALVLMSEETVDAKKELLGFAAQLIAITTDDRGTLAERMANHFSWMYALSQEDQEQCARDLVRAARASFATEQPHLAAAELTSWRETAAVIAAGLGDEPVEWLDSDELIERP